MSDTRIKLREEALKLFVSEGYSGTSIADIERAAGLAPRAGGFYRHFSSKAALAAEIGAASIIETREELGLDLLALGNTRAELILIARGYLNASERQAPLAGLIAEVRHLEEIQELERRVNEELLDALISWLVTKPFAVGKSEQEQIALLLNVFGGWLFYLTKRGTTPGPGRRVEMVPRLFAELLTNLLMIGWSHRSSPCAGGGELMPIGDGEIPTVIRSSYSHAPQNTSSVRRSAVRVCAHD